jgi:hypothetical protein
MLRVSMRRPFTTLATAALLLVLAAALACAASAAAAPRRAAPLCRTGHCHTIEESREARLFRVTRRPHGYVSYNVVYGEDRRTGRVTTVLGGEVEAQPEIELPAVNGTYAAVVLVRSGKYNEEGALVSVERVDLRTGRREITARPTTAPSEGRCDGGSPYKAPGITDLLVTSKGAVAWIIGGIYDRVTQRPDLGNYRVCLLAAGASAPTVLAAGDTIDARSLAATQERLYWSEGGEPMTAPLPG